MRWVPDGLAAPAMLEVVLRCKTCDAPYRQGKQVVQVTSEASQWPSIGVGTKMIMRVVFSTQYLKVSMCGASDEVSCRNPTGCSGWLRVLSTGKHVGYRECGRQFQTLLEKKKSTNKAKINDNAHACIHNFRVDAAVRSFKSFNQAHTDVPLTDKWCVCGFLVELCQQPHAQGSWDTKLDVNVHCLRVIC